MPFTTLTEMIEAAGNNNSELTEMNMSNKNIGDFYTITIAEAITNNTRVLNLNLRHNQIKNNGAQKLAHALKVNRTLNVLSLSENQIENEGAKALANALAENQGLQQVFLLDNPITQEGIDALSNALSKNPRIAFLMVTCNGAPTNLASTSYREAIEKRSQAQPERAAQPVPPPPSHTLREATPSVDQIKAAPALKKQESYTIPWPYQRTAGKSMISFLLGGVLGGATGFLLGNALPIIGNLIGLLLGALIGSFGGAFVEDFHPGTIKGGLSGSLLGIAIAMPLFFVMHTNPLVLAASVVAFAAGGALLMNLVNYVSVYQKPADDTKKKTGAPVAQQGESDLRTTNFAIHHTSPLRSPRASLAYEQARTADLHQQPTDTARPG